MVVYSWACARRRLLWGIPTERLLILEDAVTAVSGLKGSGYVCSRAAASSTASVRCATCACTGYQCGIIDDCIWCRLPQEFTLYWHTYIDVAASRQSVLM